MSLLVSTPLSSRPPALPAGTRRALAAGAVGTLAAVLAVVVATPLGLLFGSVALLVYGIGAVLVLGTIGASHGADRFGLPNTVTLARLVATALVAGASCDAMAGSTAGAPPFAVALMALAAIAADGLDGRLARTRGPATAFGARFDMEVDAALLMALSVFALAVEKAGAFVLLVGLMRYLYVAAGHFAPWITVPLPPSFRRKLVCVLQGGALTLLATPLLAPPASTAVVAAALAALVWSFAADVLWAFRRKGAA